MEYIGDGVYAETDGFGIWLETERDGKPERIYLEPDMVEKIRKILASL
tara:strand:+ start:168 stop:311 length:144 start_codon:yes stop_codon:yes gene_type:complete